MFQVNRLRQHENVRDVVDMHGRWIPPTAVGANVLRPGQTTGRLFLSGDYGCSEIPFLPESATHYRTISMYYCDGHFFVLPYDATQYQGGRSRADATQSTSKEPEVEEVDGDPKFDTIDWEILRFRWLAEGFITEAFLDGVYSQLNTQRPDQKWVNKLLPQAYRAEHARRTEDSLYGGLRGDLSIMLGLLAFSAYDGATADVMQQCVRPLGGQSMGWRCPNSHDEEGWVNRRGFVVHVWSWPPHSTDNDLRALEQGDYGLIWR